MLTKDAKKITQSLTRTSKMPGLSYSLPAWACQTGSKLRKIEGTPCFSCYALKGNYVRYPKIKEVQYKRLDSITNPLWVEAMAVQIKNQKYFRWHDAGDIQSVEHLRKIFAVAILTPNTRHWLPTQERKYLLEVDQSEVPDNLIIRLSGSKINGSIPNAWEHTSSVVTENAKCPSASQDGKCMDCRMCWSKDIKNVSYGKH
tara:strand:+ start:351 stop:953 length:603 start_codon:yes stop_codon:yes gene_type:complete